MRLLELPPHSHAVNFFLQNEQGVRSSCPLFPPFPVLTCLCGTILSGLAICLYSGKLKAFVSEITCESKCAVSKQVMMWSEKKKKVQKKQTKLVMSKEGTKQAGLAS